MCDMRTIRQNFRDSDSIFGLHVDIHQMYPFQLLKLRHVFSQKTQRSLAQEKTPVMRQVQKPEGW